jgi:deazaflavin-dependent oxidoreductase (nitroreductase family)
MPTGVIEILDSPLISNEMTAPKPFINRRAVSWPGSLARAGVADTLDLGVPIQKLRQAARSLARPCTAHRQRSHAAQCEIGLDGAGSPPGIHLGRRSARIHVALYRRTGGRIGGHLPGLPAARIVLVDHAGAKTGVRRTSPLIYHEADGVVAVVASQAGQPTNPAWFHNLVAHPETTLQLASEVRAVRARVARDGERECLWPKLSAVYPGYDFFQRLAKRRKIPVAILEPRDATSHPTKESGEHGRNRRLARGGGGSPNGDPLRR